MNDEPISFVSACQDFFSKGEGAKKISIPEFKELTLEDRVELRDELIREGYNVRELVDATPQV